MIYLFKYLYKKYKTKFFSLTNSEISHSRNGHFSNFSNLWRKYYGCNLYVPFLHVQYLICILFLEVPRFFKLWLFAMIVGNLKIFKFNHVLTQIKIKPIFRYLFWYWDGENFENLTPFLSSFILFEFHLNLESIKRIWWTNR